jgi:protein-tyrosine phosphatase
MSDLFPGAYWVRPGKLLAGPYPGGWSADRARERMQKVLDAGVTFFLDLTEPDEMKPYFLAAQAEARGVSVFHRRMDITDMDVPTPEHMTDILDTLDSALDEGHTVYIHCMGGIGRTGTVIGCWLVRHGLDGQAALDEIVRLRGGLHNSPETDEQRRFVRTWREGS